MILQTAAQCSGALSPSLGPVDRLTSGSEIAGWIVKRKSGLHCQEKCGMKSVLEVSFFCCCCCSMSQNLIAVFLGPS